MPKIKIRKFWDLVSEDYQKRHRISTNHVHYGPSMPTESELKLLGNAKGKKILEVGCGGGQCSIAFAKKGANATGIDPSRTQIEFAKALATKENIKAEFKLMSAEKLKGLKSNHYDIVFSAYAFPYVKNLRKAFREVKRVLKKNGVFVFSLNHPFYDTFKFGTLNVGRSYYKKGLDIFWWKVGGKKVRAYTVNRTIEGIFSALVESGFIVEKLLEPQPVKKDKAWDFSMWYPLKILKMIPSTIIFKARKK